MTGPKNGHNGDSPERPKGPEPLEQRAGRELDELIRKKRPADEEPSDIADAEGLDDLAAAARMLKSAMADEPEKLPDREALLDEVFASVKEQKTDEFDEEETARAETLGDLTDRLLAGRSLPSGSDLHRDLADTLAVCRMFHAGMHGSFLPAVKKDEAVSEAVDSAAAAPASALEDATATPASAAGPEPAAARPAGARWWAAATVMAASVAAAALVLNYTRSMGPGRSAGRATASEQLNMRAQRLRMLLPGPFPRTQTASHRIQVIYSDRMRANRDRLIRAASASGAAFARARQLAHPAVWANAPPPPVQPDHRNRVRDLGSWNRALALTEDEPLMEGGSP